MDTVFMKVSSALNKKEFQQLGWQAFQGTVEQFQNVRRQLFQEDGTTLKDKYKGRKGYAAFAEEHTHNRMSTAFQNASAVLNKGEFQHLEWKQFQGTVEQFYKFIEDFQNNYPQGYQELDGQQRVADLMFSGNTRKTYDMLSIMKDVLNLDKELFYQLRWIR